MSTPAATKVVHAVAADLGVTLDDDSAEFLAWDYHVSVCHEAAHAVVAWHFGAWPVAIQVWNPLDQRKDGDDAGHVEHRPPRSVRAEAAIAIAGWVAEMKWDLNNGDDGLTQDSCRADLEKLSSLGAVPGSPRWVRAVEDAYRILERREKAFTPLASTLVAADGEMHWPEICRAMQGRLFWCSHCGDPVTELHGRAVNCCSLCG